MQEKSTSLSPFLLLFLLCCSPSSSGQSQQAPASFASCANQKCGELTVSYPFAILELPVCPAFSPFFRLHCDATSSKLFINISDLPVQVTHITSDSLIVDASIFKATFSTSFDSIPCGGAGISYIILKPYPSPFVISNENLFGGFGCNLALLITGNLLRQQSNLAPTLPNPHFDAKEDDDGKWYFNYVPDDIDVGGCVSTCYGSGLHNPDCGNHTCCTSSLALKSTLRYASLSVQTVGYLPHNTTCDPNGTFSTFFHPNYTEFKNESYRLKLNWALPTKETDEIGIIESSDYACTANAAITIVDGVPGYLCSCPPGYIGDGYSKGSGCTDVDECTSANECVARSTCHNKEGNYTCRCNDWFYGGDGRTNGSGCHFSHSLEFAVIFGIGGVSVLFMISCCVCFVVWWKRRTKRMYFVQNGGLKFQAFLNERMGSKAMRLFTAEELETATNNYAEGMKLGVGGSGVVFKGLLNDGKLVAIKRAKDRSNSELFLNEIAILIQINHRHIVRLLGCCLETEAPLLVYEFVSNGNVAENLATKRGTEFVMSWEQRVKVARQAAEALAYLHAAASPPILHRDVKSENVLLDDNLDAKIADFGLSLLFPDDAEHVATAIEGTIGYLDPEFFVTLHLSDKSDVYSFGVMLAELITGLKPVDRKKRDPPFANLALLFIAALQKESLDKLIDSRLSNTSIDAQSHIYPSVMAVATLARRCLALEGSERPSMNQIAHELRQVSDVLQLANGYSNESTPLVDVRKEICNSEFELGAVDQVKGSQSHGSPSGSIERKLLDTTILLR